MAEIYVKVKPGSAEFRIDPGTMPEIHLEEKAEHGRANTELVKRLEKILGEKPGIISGHSSRRKKLKFDMEEEEIMEKLEGYDG